MRSKPLSFGLPVFILLFAARGFAADPALDTSKYPQDTPRAALSSIVKALESNDRQYWLTWLVTPEDTKRISEKYDSIENAVAAHQDPKHAEMIKERCELMKKMLTGNKPESGEEKGMKWTRFASDEKVLELVLQPDGRWCMNMKVTGATDKK